MCGNGFKVLHKTAESGVSRRPFADKHGAAAAERRARRIDEPKRSPPRTRRNERYPSKMRTLMPDSSIIDMASSSGYGFWYTISSIPALMSIFAHTTQGCVVM